MKNNFILTLISVFFALVIGKEFLPFSYEIVVIPASFFVFIYLKKVVNNIIIEIFSDTQNMIKADFLVKTQEASNYLSPENIMKFSLIESDARNIIISEANFELLPEWDVQSHLDQLIISSINKHNGAYNDELIL